MPPAFPLPLRNVRVVELTTVWAGPFASAFLSDWGAEVIRVESTRNLLGGRGPVIAPNPALVKGLREGGEFYFAYPNWEPGERPWNRCVVFQVHGKDKRSVTLEITEPKGTAAFDTLIRTCDVLLVNLAPDSLDALGLTYERLRRVKPDLIMVRIAAFGHRGKAKQARGLGAEAEAAAGFTTLRGHPGIDLLFKDNVAFADAAGSMSAALGALSALAQRAQTGKGQLIDISLSDAVVSLLAPALLDAAMNNREQSPQGNAHPSMVPHGCYPCSGSDRWLFLAIRNNADWQNLCEIFGNPSWARQPSLQSALGRLRNREALDVHIADWMKSRDAHELMASLQARGIPAGVVMNERDAIESAHLAERRFLIPLDHRDTGSHRYINTYWKTHPPVMRATRPPCELGQDNEWVYKNLLGTGERDYGELLRKGLAGTQPQS
jgi:crotonobetainyl-CoA:carnitine CoA-transferase CaiB-like acyl-CoA transferase